MFDKILKFEQELAEFTGAPYAIMTDCCTHAIELCLRYDQVQECEFNPYTYLPNKVVLAKTLLGKHFNPSNKNLVVVE